jgi:hypothetical protein
MSKHNIAQSLLRVTLHVSHDKCNYITRRLYKHNIAQSLLRVTLLTSLHNEEQGNQRKMEI